MNYGVVLPIYGGHWPDPFSLLAFLAGRTRRIRFGASVIVLPYRRRDILR